MIESPYPIDFCENEVRVGFRQRPYKMDEGIRSAMGGETEVERTGGGGELFGVLLSQRAGDESTKGVSRAETSDFAVFLP